MHTAGDKRGQAKMRVRYALLAALAVVPAPALAGFAAALSDHNLDGDGALHATQIDAGGFFDVFVDLSGVIPPLLRGQIRLVAGPGMTGVFTLLDAQFDDVHWSNDAGLRTVPPLPLNVTDGAYDENAPDTISTSAVGAYPATTTWPQFVRLRVQVAPGLSGHFFLGFDSLFTVFGDGRPGEPFNQDIHPSIESGFDVYVNASVIPAPGAQQLLGAVLALGLVVGRDWTRAHI